jgi:hypothetical protein
LFRGKDTNLYGYTFNDSINFNDIDGLDVELCKAVADLPFNIFKFKHHWIRTSTMEAGLGPARGNVPGEGGNSDLPFITDTRIVPHPGRGNQSGSICEKVPNIDEECVNFELSNAESKGYFLLTTYNQCQSVASAILNKCWVAPEDYGPYFRIIRLRAWLNSR